MADPNPQRIFFFWLSYCAPINHRKIGHSTFFLSQKFVERPFIQVLKNKPYSTSVPVAHLDISFR